MSFPEFAFGDRYRPNCFTSKKIEHCFQTKTYSNVLFGGLGRGVDLESLLDPLIHRKLTSGRPTLPLFRAGSRCSPSSTLFSGSILLPWTIIKQGYSDCDDAPRGDGELDSHIIHFYFKEEGDFFDNHFVPNFLSLFPRRPSGAPFGSS